jgi:hypothetical protein
VFNIQLLNSGVQIIRIACVLVGREIGLQAHGGVIHVQASTRDVIAWYHGEREGHKQSDG